MPTIRIKTNIPIIGVLKYCNYRKSDKETDGVPWPDQIALVGEWEDHGEGTLYCALLIKDQLFDLGAITKPTDDEGSRKKDQYGNPAYSVRGSPYVLISKAQTNDGIRWQAKLCDKPDTVSTESDDIPVSNATSHPADDGAPPQHGPESGHNERGWKLIRDRWKKAALLAMQVHDDVALEVEDDRVCQTATAFFIEASRHSLT